MSESDLVLMQAMLATLAVIAVVVVSIKPFDRLMDRLFRR